MKRKSNLIKKKNVTITKKLFPCIIATVICLIIIIGILCFPFPKKTHTTMELSDTSTISSICELATLKSFYHNVVVYEKEPNGGEKFVNDVIFWPFGDLIRTGYKQYWMEYSGVVEMGVNAGQIQIKSPTSKGVVEVFVPDATILNVYADEESLSNPITEEGLFTSISGEEKIEAFSNAQKAMRKEAQDDQALLNRAKDNAKILLEKYIINIGKETGSEYTVKWI